MLGLLPAGAVAGWGFHPLESAVFARRTPNPDMADVAQKEKAARRRPLNSNPLIDTFRRKEPGQSRSMKRERELPSAGAVTAVDVEDIAGDV